jgi:hypothetical protein
MIAHSVPSSLLSSIIFAEQFWVASLHLSVYRKCHGSHDNRSVGKRNLSPTNGRRKADESTIEAPTNKKSMTNAAVTNNDIDCSDEGSTIRLEESVSMLKMTNEEKRKTFLERNRYVLQSLIVLYCGSLLILLEPASLPTSVA